MPTPIEIVREKYSKIKAENEKRFLQECEIVENECAHPKEYIKKIIIPFNPGFYALNPDRDHIECTLCGKTLKILE